MLNRLFHEKIYCGLDVGTQHLKASILKASSNGSQELLGIGESPTQGLDGFAVSNLNEFAESISRTLNGLMKTAGVRIKDIHLGVGGGLVQSRKSSSVIPLIDRGHKIISTRDVKNVNHQACLLGVKMDEELLCDFPQRYQVDDVNTALNPLGLQGRKLAADLLLFVADNARLSNILSAVHQAGFEVEDVWFSSLAASQGVIKDEPRQAGCVLIDIGASATEVLIFKDGVLRFRHHIDSGGNHVTRRLAEAFHFSFDLAEDIKKSYAVALQTASGQQDREEEILVKKEDGYVPVSRQAIHQTIEPGIEQWVTDINQSLKQSQLYDQINTGIVMVGGGSLLPGLIERIEHTTNLTVQLGKGRFTNLKANNAPVIHAAIGLAQQALQKSVRYDLSVNGHSDLMKNIISKAKELYQEYF